MTDRKEVYAAIDGERLYQDQRWVTDENPHIHSLEEWLVYIEGYVNEAKHILSRNGAPDCYEGALHIVRKVTAMGVACMEQNGVRSRTCAVKG